LAAVLVGAPALGAGLSLEEALNAFSSECAQCAAYFGLSHRCFVSSGQLQGDDKASIVESLKFFYELQYATGKAVGMSDKAIEGRFGLALDSINNDMDNDCVNISVIKKSMGSSAKLSRKIRISSSSCS
jgi:hypothetical protein